MISCWDGDPQNRPSFKALKESINEMNTADTPGGSNPVPPISTELDQQSSCYKVLSNYRRKPCAEEEPVGTESAAGSEAIVVDLGDGNVGVVPEEEGVVNISELSTGKQAKGRQEVVRFGLTGPVHNIIN